MTTFSRTVLCLIGVLLFCGMKAAAATYDHFFSSLDKLNVTTTGAPPPDQGVRSVKESYDNKVTFTVSGVDRVQKELGIKGAGVKVGIISTGFDIRHEALVTNYNGRLANNSFNHNYNWFDAFGSPVPVDARFVGSHLTGVAVGSKHGIGVAPAAKFISCRSIDDLERETPETQIKCIRFFSTMHDLNGNNPLPELVPDVVYVPYSDSSFGDVLVPAIRNLTNAGAVVITNAAPREEFTSICAKQVRAPSFYREVFAVGSTNITTAANGTIQVELLSITSAGGPVFFFNGSIDVSNLKPNVVVPGSDITSSVYIDGKSLYLQASGTPVSAPFAVGIAALVISSNPKNLKRRVRDVIEILHHAAKPIPSLDCSSLAATPNNVFGYGSLDAYAAVQRAQEFPYGGCPVEPKARANCNMASFSQLDILQIETIDGTTLTTQKELNFLFRSSSPRDLDELGYLWNGKTTGYLSLCIYDTPVPFGLNTVPFFLKEGFKIMGVGKTKDNKKTKSQGPANLTLSDSIMTLTLDNKTGTIRIVGSGNRLALSRAWAGPLQRFAVNPSVVVQLHSSTGACWSSNFTASQVMKNTKEAFNGVITLPPI